MSLDHLSEEQMGTEVRTSVWMERIMKGVGRLALVGALWFGGHAITEGIDNKSEFAFDALNAAILVTVGAVAFGTARGARNFRGELNQHLLEISRQQGSDTVQ